MAAKAPSTICSGIDSGVGRAVAEGACHIRYWMPNEGVSVKSPVVVAVSTSRGWARRHHHTASSATTMATLVPIAPAFSHSGSCQTGSFVG